MARWGWHRGENAESMSLIPRPVWQIFQEDYSYNNGNESIPESRKLPRPISCQDTQQTERQICIPSHGQIITCPAIARCNWIIWMSHLHSTISDFAIAVWHLNNVFLGLTRHYCFFLISCGGSCDNALSPWNHNKPVTACCSCLYKRGFKRCS